MPGLTGNAEVVVDAAPAGEVAVVAVAAPVRNRVAFVVENGSDASVRVVKVTGIAERSNGSQVTRASTTEVVPARLAPGERAIGRLAFRRGTIDADPTLTWKVRTARAPSTPDPTRLAVGALALSPPTGDAVGAPALAMVVSNPHSGALAGPLLVEVLCLDEAGGPAALATTTVERRTLRAGSEEPVTVKLRDPCPGYVVGARARAAR